MEPLEIERKFLIAMPDAAWMASRPDLMRFEIAQTYLLSPEGEERRVRRKSTQGGTVYVQTMKRALSGAARVEIEEEISVDDYRRLLQSADPMKRTIEKTRYSFSFAGHTIEIDIYPFWTDRAIAEVELADEKELLSLPDDLVILREVTDDPRYKNAALAGAKDLTLL